MKIFFNEKCLEIFVLYDTGNKLRDMFSDLPVAIINEEKVREILCNQFDVDEDAVTLTTRISEDLGADSLDAVDMLMSLEDEFDVEIPDEEIENIRTVGDLVSYIEEHQ